MRNTVAVAILAASLSGHAGNPAWAQSATPAAPPRPQRVPSTIPLFPLPDVVLFPDAALPLRIFEPRYRAMVADAIKGNHIIGMVLLQPGHEADYEGRPPIFPVGCAGIITQVEQLPNGEYTLVLRGLQRFRVMSEDPGGAYRVAHITPLPEPPPDEPQTAAIRTERQRVASLLGIVWASSRRLQHSGTRVSSSASRKSWSSLRSSGKNCSSATVCWRGFDPWPTGWRRWRARAEAWRSDGSRNDLFWARRDLPPAPPVKYTCQGLPAFPQSAST